MSLKAFLQKSFDRHYGFMMRAVDGLTPDELAWRPGPASNSIGFLVWHYGRAMDLWIQNQAQAAPQLWETEWARRFGREPDPNDLGFGYTEEQLAAFKLPDTSILLGYAEATYTSAKALLDRLDDDAIAQTTVKHRNGITFGDLQPPDHGAHITDGNEQTPEGAQKAEENQQADKVAGHVPGIVKARADAVQQRSQGQGGQTQRTPIALGQHAGSGALADPGGAVDGDDQRALRAAV